MRIAAWTLCLATSLNGQQADGVVSMITGEQFIGKLEALIDGTTLRFTKGKESRDVLLDELQGWQRSATKDIDTKPAPAEGMLRTRSGMQLSCAFIDADDLNFRFMMPCSSAPVSFALRHLASLRLLAGTKNDGGFARAVDNPPTTNDLLFATNRDTGKITRLSVVIQGSRNGDLNVLFRDQPQTVAIDQIYGLIFGTDLGAPPKMQNRPTVLMSLTHDEKVSGRMLGWDGKTSELLLAEGATMMIPCVSVEGFTVQSSRMLYLSDLEPKTEQIPAFDRIRPWQRDSAPLGAGLELDGVTYARGLCLIPLTKLTFRLDGTYGFFEAVVGIDDRSSNEANADIRIYTDDQLVFEAKAVGHGDPGRKVRIALKGREHLTLEAAFGNNFDLGDHCLFANARLLKN